MMTQIPFFAIDPMLESSVGWKILGIVIAKVITVFTIGLLATMFMVWFERKIVSGMQNRIGPNKAGPFGILQTVADGVKLIFKEDFMPEKADRKVYVLAPFLAFVPALLLWLVLPLGGDFSNGKNGEVTVFGEVTRIQLMDAPVGILFVLALSSIGVYGIMLAGWSSGSKYPLLGSVRASAQMISYEAALGLSVGTVLLMSGSVQISDIVSGQHGLMNWNVVATGVVPFIIFFIAMTAELNRPPFDLVEAEQELVGGFNTEYAGFQFALFFLAEFMNVVTMSAVMVTLFLGGPQPLLIGGFDLFGWMPWGLGGSLWLGLKVLVFLYVYVWLRATLPRLRYDQLMDFGWKILIPLSLGWFLVLAGLQVARDRFDGFGPILLTSVIAVAILVAASALLSAAVKIAAANRESEGTVY